jgi:predicted RecA/RadA family phage recombinase
MPNNFVQQGWTVTAAAPYAVANGGGVQIGNTFGVATVPLSATGSITATVGQSIELATIGVWDLPKDTSTFADGAVVFWDNVNYVCTSNTNNTLKIGVATLADPSGVAPLGGSSGDATVRVRLVPVTSPAASSTANGRVEFNCVHATYSFAVDGGAIGAITPVGTATIPANAIIVGATVNSPTAVTSGGSATVAIGTTAGSSASSILTATAKASLSVDALINGTVTLASPVKMSAAGSVNFTVAVAALTAGVIEVWVYYVASANA